jgi:tetratricopeptide (TPR) repeat protein
MASAHDDALPALEPSPEEPVAAEPQSAEPIAEPAAAAHEPLFEPSGETAPVAEYSPWPGPGAESATSPAPAEAADAPLRLEAADQDAQAGEQSRLPWAKSDGGNAQMHAVTQRADERVRRGFKLAERGAVYTARREFLAALQMVAQANDVQNGTTFFTQAMGAGLTALKEATDFSRQDALGTPVDVARVVRGHRTPILKDESDVSPLAAAQRYYNYAQEQLSAAAAKDPAGSMALYGLGRSVLGLKNQNTRSLDKAAQAMAFYQAALMSDAKNFRAANELGVLMCDNGNLQQARDLFRHSAAASPQATTWMNLATVHMRLHEPDLAMQAKVQAQELARLGRNGSDPIVHVVDPGTFARTKPASDALPPSAQPVAPEAAKPAGAPSDKPAASTASRGLSDWLPWNQRR